MFCTSEDLNVAVQSTVKPLVKILEYNLKTQVVNAELALMSAHNFVLKSPGTEVAAEIAELYRVIKLIEAVT